MAGCNFSEPCMQAAFGGRRRCDLCGIETRTPLCMHQHVASRQHCLSVAKAHLEAGGEGEGDSRESSYDAQARAQQLRLLVTESLRRQVPEPPDAALWELYTAAKRAR